MFTKADAKLDSDNLFHKLALLEKVPTAILYVLFDSLSLSSIATLSGVSKTLKSFVADYFKKELKIKEIACGHEHTLILLDKGRVLATGSTAQGQLGLLKGKPFIVSGFTGIDSFTEITGIDRIEAISAGFYHSVLLSKKKEVWIMGKGSEDQFTFRKAVSGQSIDINLQEDPVPKSEEEQAREQIFFQKVSGLNAVKAMVAVDFTTAVLNEDGTVKIGGPGTLNPYIINGKLSLLPHWVGDTLPEDLDITDVSFGKKHALLLTKEGEVYGIGSNECGLLGLKDIENCSEWVKLLGQEKVSKIKATELGSLILTSDQCLLVSGININRQLGNFEKVIPHFVEVARDVKDFDASDCHTLYLDNENKLYGMGKNNAGQLGCALNPTSLISVKEVTRFAFSSSIMQNLFLLKSNSLAQGRGHKEEEWGEEDEDGMKPVAGVTLYDSEEDLWDEEDDAQDSSHLVA